MIHRVALLPVMAACLLSGCNITDVDDGRPESAREFPEADRPVSSLGASQFASERARDDRREAVTVMDLANIRKGMTVADIGAELVDQGLQMREAAHAAEPAG